MKITKQNNQYYGEYFEKKILNLINKQEQEINDINFQFSEEDIKELNTDAEKVYQCLQANSALYLGRQTKNASGDLLIDNQIIELKYVSSGKGTYFNTSMSYFSKEKGYPEFHDYLKKYGVLDFLSQFFGDKVYKNISPVSMANSSVFRHEQPQEYEKLKNLEAIARKHFVQDLTQILKNNPNLLHQFVYDMITKNIANKQIPDQLVIFNHETKSIIIINQQEIQSYADDTDFYNTDFGLIFKNFRVQFGWQNGTGLNNPTIRVFL